MFASRLKHVLAQIGATTADIAGEIGCNQSNISRMCSGARVPKSNGLAAAKLAVGVCTFADRAHTGGALRRMLGCQEDADAESTVGQLLRWLYDGSENAHRSHVAARGSVPYPLFGERLDAVMTLTGLSNAYLSRQLNIDPSYISRFRSGARLPRVETRTLDEICHVIVRRAGEQGRQGALAEMIGLAGAEAEDEQKIALCLRLWLYRSEREQEGVSVMRLLEQIDTFPAPRAAQKRAQVAPPPVPTVPEERDIYFGSAGLRRAVERFLVDVLRQGGTELMLYSDQNMEWLVSDARFRRRWMELMAACVSQGVQICIIHNLERDLGELTEAIISWMPLYMSGMIRSYSCRRQHGTRFSHTLFLCPGLGCIEGNNVIGQEERNGIYCYHTDPVVLSAYGIAFDGLLAQSRKLIQIVESGHPLPEDGEILDPPQFPNTRIVLGREEVVVIRRGDPSITFQITHPALRRAFLAYREILHPGPAHGEAGKNSDWTMHAE